MSKFGKSMIAACCVLVLAACAAPDGSHAGTQRPQPGWAAMSPSGGGGGNGGY
ncbi:MAG TPA: hypothetical protein VGI78_27490 [Acetobacteraceae bacterium]|jgi:outer membrane biogenesis lipoprotein LolB